MGAAEDYKGLEKGSDELVSRLVEENMGWAQAIARSVARAWNLDWQIDGLDGGAYEGLLFCAGRYDPVMGVPFRAYARRRIHESATDEARKSKSWKRGVGSKAEGDMEAREISMRLFDVYPELREGLIPGTKEEGSEEGVRSAIRQLLASASMIAAFQESTDNPENIAQYRQMLGVISDLEHVHQSIVYAVYWKGQSMRGLATEWEVDELTVIREHKEIVKYLCSKLSEGPSRAKKLKIRPGLRPVAQRLRKEKEDAPFAQFATAVLLFWAIISPLLNGELIH